jgi:hypothetical protein
MRRWMKRQAGPEDRPDRRSGRRRCGERDEADRRRQQAERNDEAGHDAEPDHVSTPAACTIGRMIGIDNTIDRHLLEEHAGGEQPNISTTTSAVGLATSGSAKCRSSVGRREKDMKREKICAAISSISSIADTLTESTSACADVARRDTAHGDHADKGCEGAKSAGFADGDDATVDAAEDDRTSATTKAKALTERRVLAAHLPRHVATYSVGTAPARHRRGSSRHRTM